MAADWDAHVAAWSSPPVDHLNQYVPSRIMLRMGDRGLKDLVEGMRRERFNGWRNHGNLWREMMGLDISGRTIMDFGCGIGLEALELARVGNRVILADISMDNLELAARILNIHGYKPEAEILVSGEPPYVHGEAGTLDTFHCSGVLHHVRWPREIMRRAWEMLKPSGYARLMLYSDLGWRQATQTEPPDDTEHHPLFSTFVRHFDQVGDYADWYNRAKLVDWFGGWFGIRRFEYLTPWGQYCAAILEKR